MATELDTAKTNYDNYRYCYDNGHQEWLVKASRCFNVWQGNQWDAGDVAKLKAARRPYLTLNIVESLVRAMVGLQRSLRNDVRFAPKSPEAVPLVAAQDAVWLDIENQNNLDFRETEVFLRGMVTGRGYYDVRVDFSDSLQGTTTIRTPRAQDIVLDPCFTEYEPKTWPQFYERCWTNLLDIDYLYGPEKAEALRSRSCPEWFALEDQNMGKDLGRLPFYMQGWGTDQAMNDLVRAYMVLSRQFYQVKMKNVFVDTRTGDTSEVPESWDRGEIAHVLQTVPDLIVQKQRVKTVRWTVTCDDVVLHDEDSPYKRFTIVPYFPTCLDGITMGVVEHLIDPQLLYNKITSQELHIVNTTANSGWKTKAGNIINYTAAQLEQVGAQTGLVLEVEDITQTEKITPNQVPTAHDRLSMKADSVLRSLSGVSNQSRGFAREDVAGEAILANQAAQDVNFAGALANLHRSKQLLAMSALDCVQAYYSETRVIMINRGSTYKPEYDQVTINQPSPEGQMLNDVTMGEYTTVLVPSAARTSMSESDFKELVKLRTEAGIMIPDDVMLECAPLSANKVAMLQRMKSDSTEQQARVQQLEERNAELESQLTAAKIDKERSAGQLNAARAQKAAGEAGRDPDAAYERVENARIASDHMIALGQQDIDRERVGLERRGQNHSTAVALTKIESENARHQQTLVANAAKTVKPPKPSTPAKPPAKKKPR